MDTSPYITTHHGTCTERRRVHLSRFNGEGACVTYRCVEGLADTQIIVVDVPASCMDWQVAVLTNGSNFCFDSRLPLTVSFKTLGWGRTVYATPMTEDHHATADQR